MARNSYLKGRRRAMRWLWLKIILGVIVLMALIVVGTALFGDLSPPDGPIKIPVEIDGN